MAEVRRSNPDAFKQLAVNIGQLGQYQGKVGWFDNAKYKDGTPIAYIAAIHEFGCPAKNIPPRLGMRFTMAAKKQEWRQVSEKVCKAVLGGKISGQGAIEGITEYAAADFVSYISSNPPPALKAATLATRRRRGQGERTLNASGLLISSLTSKVESI